MDPPVHASPWSPSGRMPPTLGLVTVKAGVVVTCTVLLAGVANLEALAVGAAVAAVVLVFGEGDLEVIVIGAFQVLIA